MVLKFGSEPNDVFFIEATSNLGVALKRWSGMRHALGSFYSKIALRHLDWDRPDESLDILEQFIKETQGNAYQFKLGQLKKRQTVALKKDFNSPIMPIHNKNANRSQSEKHDSREESKEMRLVEKGRAFFCSELVAKAWKCAGIMKPTNDACSNFLPSHWTSEK